MNKYIKTDLEQAVSYMKTAIMNTLHDIDSGEEEEIDLGPNLSWNLFNNCLEEAGWEHDDTCDWDPNGWQVDFWDYWFSPSGKFCCIQGSLWDGLNYKISVNHDDE